MTDTTLFHLPSLTGDSEDYNILSNAAKAVANVEGMTCEIGLRRGGGSKVIIDALSGMDKTHIAIDPYGNIEYQTTDAMRGRFDYTNDMRDECLYNMYSYCRIRKVNFLFFNLEDVEFFARFADGVPLYNERKRLENRYSLVHFDGPHSVIDLTRQINFFRDRTETGARFVFDDVPLYDHSNIHGMLQLMGWKLGEKSFRKWSYVKC